MLMNAWLSTRSSTPPMAKSEDGQSGREPGFKHKSLIRDASRALFISLVAMAIPLLGVESLIATSQDVIQLAQLDPVPSTKPQVKQEAKADSLKPKPASRTKPVFTKQDSLWVPYIRNDSIRVENPGPGYLIRVSKNKRQLTLFKDGIAQKVYSVGVGKNSRDKAKKDDNATPEGSFAIASIHNSKDWLYEGKKVYGPWFLRIDTSRGAFSGGTWTGIGIHGTSNEKSIGSFVSKGCIRMYNKDIAELKEIVATAMESSTVRVLILP